MVEIHVRVLEPSTYNVVANRKYLSQFYSDTKFRICLVFLRAPNLDVRLIPASNVVYKHVDKNNIFIKVW